MNTEDSFNILINLRSYSDEELKQLSTSLEEEEREISRRRRVLHGELDIVRAEIVRRLRDKHKAGESVFGEDDISRLSEILSARSGVDSGETPVKGE